MLIRLEVKTGITQKINTPLTFAQRRAQPINPAMNATGRDFMVIKHRCHATMWLLFATIKLY
jgi:hypothetical protein